MKVFPTLTYLPSMGLCLCDALLEDPTFLLCPCVISVSWLHYYSFEVSHYYLHICLHPSSLLGQGLVESSHDTCLHFL